MTYTRYGEEPVLINIIPAREIPESKMQYCWPESDERIRAIIRGMDNRERMIVLDELRKIESEHRRG